MLKTLTRNSCHRKAVRPGGGAFGGGAFSGGAFFGGMLTKSLAWARMAEYSADDDATDGDYDAWW